jgi:hypothetical protein
LISKLCQKPEEQRKKVVTKFKVATKTKKTYPTFQTPMIIWWV